MLATLGVLVGRDALAARAHLTTARAEITEFQDALQAGDVAAAREHALSAREAAAAADSRTDGVGWAILGPLPWIGDNLRTVQALGDLGSATAELTVQAVDQAGPLLTGELSILAGPNQVDLDQLADLGAGVRSIDPVGVREAADRLRGSDVDRLVDQVVEARATALGLADRALATADRADAALTVLPAFFGEGGARQYLVVLQTPAELRGTGGLSTYLSVLRATDGRLGVEPAERLNAFLVAVDEEGLPNLTPVPADESFAARYDHLLARGYVGNVNVDPDLPMVGPIMLDIAESQTDERFDGAILLDPIGLQQILRGGPPLDIPDGVNKAPLPDPIPIDQLAEILLIDQYDVVNGVPEERRAYLDAVSKAAIDRLLADELDLRRLLDGFGDAIATRHLQLYSRDADEQALFADIGAAGAMTQAGDGTDVLAVTGNNAAADKKDVHVGHRISGQLTLGSLRDAPDDAGDASVAALLDGGAEVLGVRSGTIEVEMVNPLGSTGHDTYILGSSEPQQMGAPRPERLPVGPARTWFTVWTPLGTEASALRVEGEPALFGTGTIHGHRAFDYFLEVPMESSRSFELDLTGPAGLRWDGDELVYDLTLWRQAKGIPDVWDLSIAPPEGWAVSGVDVRGGGQPRTGFGAIDDAPALSGTVEDDVARVVGGATEDAVISVRLNRNP